MQAKSKKNCITKIKKMATTIMSSLSLKPSSPFVGVKGLPSLPTKTSFKVSASGAKKIKTDKPFGIVY